MAGHGTLPRSLRALHVCAYTTYRQGCGYCICGRGLAALVCRVHDTLDALGAPKVSGGPTPVAGLYFCGFFISPTGQLREIGLEARRIATHIARAGMV
jgi:hypothetical protein